MQRSCLRIAAVLAFASGIAWVAASLVSMTGNVASIFDTDALAAFFTETGFGRAWALRLVISLALIPALVPQVRNVSARAFSTGIVVVLAALLLVSQAWIGHPAASTGLQHILVVTAYALHVLGAGAWLGGLLPLWLILRAQSAGDAELRLCAFALQRFSSMGMLVIAAILVGGIVNAWARWDSLQALIASAWGEVLIAKVFVFVGLLLLAGANRFLLMPQLPADDHVLERLARNVAVEQACGLAILGAAAMLGILAPPT